MCGAEVTGSYVRCGGDRKLCAVQKYKCREVWYKNRSVGTFGTTVEILGSFGTWLELVGILRRKEKHISALKRNKTSCNS